MLLTPLQNPGMSTARSASLYGTDDTGAEPSTYYEAPSVTLIACMEGREHHISEECKNSGEGMGRDGHGLTMTGWTVVLRRLRARARDHERH